MHRVGRAHGDRGDFGKASSRVVLLRISGAEPGQAHDIRCAHAYWRDCLEAEHGTAE